MKTPVLDDSRFVILFVYLLEAAIKKMGTLSSSHKGMVMVNNETQVAVVF